MFARTDRLLLRPGWIEDASALTQAIGDESIVRNLARAPWPYLQSDAETYLARTGTSHLPDFLIFSRTRGAPRLIGGCGISPVEDRDGLELGYWIARPYWGLGFATEAARAVMQIARATGLRGVTARHFLDNRASGKVLQKAGFRQTGIIEPLASAARPETAPAALYEMTDEADMPRTDIAFELYGDEAQPMAA